jgi:D-xylose transport system substrate-binding protein
MYNFYPYSRRRRTMRRNAYFLVLVTMLGLFLAGCSRESKKDDKLTIGILFDFLSVESRVRQRDSLVEFAEEYDVNLVFQNANGDEKTQLQQAENLISQGVDALAILAQNTEACKPIVDGCREAGIPLIVTDRLIANADLDYFVGVNNDVIGYMQVEYMLKQKPEGRWALIAGAPTDPNSRLWHDSWVERLEPYVSSGAITVVADERCDNWDPNIALKHMENILTVNDDRLDVAMVMNDGLGTGVTQALEARGLAGRVLMCGLDGETVAYQRIVQGKQAMTIFLDDVAIAKALLLTSVAAAKKETVTTNGTVNNGFEDVPAYLVEPTVIDKNNLDELIINSGYLSREEIYK